jgi:phospholipid transport system substrate-binding protein
VTFVLVLSVISPAFTHKGARGEAPAQMIGAASGPLEVVTSSLSRRLASRGASAVRLAADRHADVRAAVDDLFDVDDVARRALGQHWKSLVPRERHEFVRLFRPVLTQSFMQILQCYTGDHVPPLETRVAGAFAQVRSHGIAEQGSEVTVEYRLSQRGSRWSVYDIVFDGASLVSNYRSQFNSIIATSAVAHLLERMHTEPLARPQSPDAVVAATAVEPETSLRSRLAAGLLLAAASRWVR